MARPLSGENGCADAGANVSDFRVGDHGSPLRDACVHENERVIHHGAKRHESSVSNGAAWKLNC